MANQEQVSLINQGAQVWNQWRQDHPEVRPDLYAAHLKSTDLSGMDLSSATLTVAILYRADLSQTDLHGADVSSANLMEATLPGANMNQVDLRGSYCHRADMTMVDFGNGDLRGVLLDGADLQGANLAGADLGAAHLYRTKNLTVEQLCSVRSLWLTELHDREELVGTQCPQLLQRPSNWETTRLSG